MPGTLAPPRPVETADEQRSRETAELVAAVVAGDHGAWGRLVDRFNGLLWWIARAHRLEADDAADVVQTTWLKFVQSVDRLREPERAGAWLATTARRECLRTLRQQGRQVPTDDETVLEPPGASAPLPEDEVLRSERDAVLWQAVEQLPGRGGRLMRMLLSDPAPSYEEVSETLGMPIGSIGPTRARCLERLRRSAGVAALLPELTGPAMALT